MKTKTMNCIFLAFLFALVVGATSPASSEPTGTLIVSIIGFPSSDGFAMVALHDSEKSYQGGSPIAKKKEKVEGQKARVVFKDLPYGSYAVSIYHDENANGKLDTNPMGIPKEAYGFSNNARGSFGKPGYQDVKFDLNSAEMEILINLK
jgi:uncharacterized protein (DUF2141 family)